MRSTPIREIAMVVAILLLLPTVAGACQFSYTGPNTEVARSITVGVHFEGKPLAGATVALYPVGPAGKLSKTTAADGTAQFTNLETGKYLLSVSHLELYGASEHIEVLPRASAQAKPRLEYPWGENPTLVRQAAGTLTTTDPRANELKKFLRYLGVEFPIAGSQIELVHARNGSVFKKKSDYRGAFAFSGVPSGTYVLHLEHSGTFLVRVTPQATKDSLHAVLAGGLCGTGFTLVP